MLVKLGENPLIRQTKRFIMIMKIEVIKLAYGFSKNPDRIIGITNNRSDLPAISSKGVSDK